MELDAIADRHLSRLAFSFSSASSPMYRPRRSIGSEIWTRGEFLPPASQTSTPSGPSPKTSSSATPCVTLLLFPSSSSRFLKDPFLVFSISLSSEPGRGYAGDCTSVRELRHRKPDPADGRWEFSLEYYFSRPVFLH